MCYQQWQNTLYIAALLHDRAHYVEKQPKSAVYGNKVSFKPLVEEEKLYKRGGGKNEWSGTSSSSGGFHGYRQTVKKNRAWVQATNEVNAVSLGVTPVAEITVKKKRVPFKAARKSHCFYTVYAWLINEAHLSDFLEMKPPFRTCDPAVTVASWLWKLEHPLHKMTSEISLPPETRIHIPFHGRRTWWRQQFHCMVKREGLFLCISELLHLCKFTQGWIQKSQALQEI